MFIMPCYHLCLVSVTEQPEWTQIAILPKGQTVFPIGLCQFVGLHLSLCTTLHFCEKRKEKKKFANVCDFMFVTPISCFGKLCFNWFHHSDRIPDYKGIPSSVYLDLLSLPLVWLMWPLEKPPWKMALNISQILSVHAVYVVVVVWFFFVFFEKNCCFFHQNISPVGL